MCSPSYKPPPPPPSAPPQLDQLAPKTASEGDNARGRKRKGLSQYRTDTAATPAAAGLGAIPKKTGV